MICELDDRDFCARHQRVHSGQAKALALDAGPRGEKYRADMDLVLRNQQAGIAKRVVWSESHEAGLGDGPGTELVAILRTLGAPECDRCKEYARQMNGWGASGCEEKRNEIIGHLEDERRKLSWWAQMLAGGLAIRHGLPLTTGGLVDEAIKRARAKGVAAQAPPSPRQAVAVPNYAGIEKPVIRNMLMHIWPARGNGVWQWNVQQVLKRIDLFNGKRIVAIATDGRSDSADAVKRLFGDTLTSVVELTNNPGLREVETFLPLFSQVQSTAPNEATVYLQSKGVTRGLGHTNGTTATYWAEMMYEGLLDYWPQVERILETYPVCGMFKKVGHGFAGSRSQWHYSGSFFWFANRALFSRNWREIDRIQFGIEPYPSLHFGAHEAWCLFLEGIVGVCNDANRTHAMQNRHLDLYDWRYCMEFVKPRWEQWKREHASA